MDDLISRKAFLRHVENQHRQWGNDYDAEQILGDLEDFPSAQKKGHWINGKRMKMDGTYYWFRQCSACDYERNDDDSDKDTNFCPDCGADMRGEEDG